MAKKRIVVCGGHPTWLKTFKNICGDVRFISPDDYSFDIPSLRRADIIWIQPNSISHGQERRIRACAKQYKIPVRYFGFASAKKCAEQMKAEMKGV